MTVVTPGLLRIFLLALRQKKLKLFLFDTTSSIQIEQEPEILSSKNWALSQDAIVYQNATTTMLESGKANAFRILDDHDILISEQYLDEEVEFGVGFVARVTFAFDFNPSRGTH